MLPPRSTMLSFTWPVSPSSSSLPAIRPGGERRRVERRLQLVGEIGQRADMVLVAVGQDDPGEPLLLVLDELEVGQDQLDPGIVGSAKVRPRSTIIHWPRQP